MDELDLTDDFGIQNPTLRAMMIPRYIGPYCALKFDIETETCVVLTANLVDSPHSNYKVALKCIPKNNYRASEVDIMSQVRHPNIINFIDSFEYNEKEPHFYVIAMAHAYQDLLGYFDENSNISLINSARIIYDILNALKYLHQNGIWHRDIKPDNIFIVDYTDQVPLAAIGDFGLSIKYDYETFVGEGTGTTHYAAPELIEEKRDPYGFHKIEFKAMAECLF